MGGAGEEAAAVVAQFARDGFVAEESRERAEFGVWDRVTPGRVVLVALQTVLRLRREDGRDDAARPPRGGASGLGGEEHRVLVPALLGDASAAREAERRGLITLDHVLGLLASVVAEESMSEAETGELLAAAEESCAEAEGVATGRGIDTGPWDEDDARRPQGGRVIDLGALLVPRPPGVELHPMRSDDGAVVAVTVVRGRTAIQLQAFRASSDTSWESIRGQLTRSMRRNGGSVEERTGPAGVELQTVVPVRGKSRGQISRVLGCDGPGWVLRGFVTGAGAEPGSTEEWAYTAFRGTVVRASYAPPARGAAIALRWPPAEG
ncbi:DUF3710 domain-containing protein [Streptomyces sp. t39]|uniref:DUF3710 domain-containing protein n=1 Tax=Streptomyces sp. t39 TaxID=1828156 RepID=UPI0011CDC190|nr:DUF3710 domain-containing protein [Streptomyces sp. t39]TXS55009.1 DUF3710 domain-containing protein [Streptomyces sp. t39]